MEKKDKELVKSLAVAANEIYPEIQVSVFTEQLSKLITELSRAHRCANTISRYDLRDNYANKELLLESVANVEIITESVKAIFEKDLESFDYDSILKQKIDIFNNRILSEVKDIPE